MAQIDKPNLHFNTKLYTGNSSTQSITTGLDNDFVWIKHRTVTSNHRLFDILRGGANELGSNTTSAEGQNTQGITFNSTGFDLLGGDPSYNGSGNTYASWNWKAGGTAVSNTAGSITSSVSANTTAGFSIVKYTGTGASATVGHGLGVAPKMIIGKGLGNTINWTVGGSNISSNWTGSLSLNSTGAVNVANYWQDQAPNTNTFALTSDIGVNASGLDFIAYCFSEVKGFSKFGSYVGNSSATDGTFVYLGFKPAFVIIKGATNASSWLIQDNKRQTYNDGSIPLFKANTNDAEINIANFDMLSNGFKCRTSNNDFNGANTYIYMAFAENPLVGTNGIPATAR